MEKMKCGMYGKTMGAEEVCGFYPEDDSIICKNCYGTGGKPTEDVGTE